MEQYDKVTRYECDDCLKIFDNQNDATACCCETEQMWKCCECEEVYDTEEEAEICECHISKEVERFKCNFCDEEHIKESDAEHCCLDDYHTYLIEAI